MKQFGACLMLHLLFPLVPIGVEVLVIGHVTASTLNMATVMYAFAIGSSSHRFFNFILSMVIAVVFAIVYGLSIGPGPEIQVEFIANGAAARAALSFLFLNHGFERYDRHLTNKAPFLHFVKENE